jgi:hypothetical protein
MADDDGTQMVTIRDPQTLAEREVPRNALLGFPGWELLDKTGRKASHQPTKES